MNLPERLAAMADPQLFELYVAVRSELSRRALADGDSDAIAEQAWQAGFGREGWPALPWIFGQVLVCPGGKVAKNQRSHRCRFVSVEGDWVWDHADVIADFRRGAGVGGMQSVTLLPCLPGLVLEVVDSRMMSGRHERQAVTRLTVSDTCDELHVEKANSSSAPDSHR